MTGHGMFGYLGELGALLERYFRTISDPVFYYLLRAVTIPIEAAFIMGMLASFVLMLAIMCVLLIPYLVLSVGVGLAKVSLTGAIVVFIIAGIIIAALLRKHWEAVIEAFAWGLATCEGIWKSFVPPEKGEMVMASAAAAGAHNASYSRGGNYMSDRSSPVSRDDNDERAGVPAVPEVGIPFNPANIVSSVMHRVKALQATKALNQHADMVRSANRVEQEGLNNYDLQTERKIAPNKRVEKIDRQELSTLKTKDELTDYKAERDYKANLPKNPIDLQFETQLKPRIDGDIRKPLHEAQGRAQRILEAAATLKGLEKEIDAGPYSPEEKEILKKQIKAEFDGLLSGAPPKE